MNRKQTNYICLGISFLPFLFAFFSQTRLIEYPSTHLFSGNSVNPAPIDRQMFLFLIFFSGIGFYFLSDIVSRSLLIISPKINIVYSRYFMNCILSTLGFLLILQNLK